MPALDVATDITEALGHQWFVLASPGPYFNGTERRAMAEIIREDPTHVGTPDGLALEAAVRIAHRPATITAEWLDEMEQLGLPRGPYVEIVGIVSRLVAVDTFVRAVGAKQLDLPDPLDGPATGEIEMRAKQRRAFVPIMEPAAATTALSLLPSESAARRDLHAALYLDDDDMADAEIVRDLTRAQMELIAAHTSFLNECFY